MLLAFDLDGTLITCAPRQQSVLRAVLGPERDRIDLREIWLAKRNGHSTREALGAAGVAGDRANELARRWQAIVEEPIWLQLDQCFVDTRPVLANLRQKGVRLALLTARSKPWWVVPQLRRLGLDDFFEEIVIVAPAQAANQKAEQLRRLRPAAFIGDSESDFAAARASGVEFLAVETGQRSSDFLRARGAQLVGQSLSHLRLVASHGRPHNLSQPRS